jgi:hypothetical protein
MGKAMAIVSDNNTRIIDNGGGGGSATIDIIQMVAKG